MLSHFMDGILLFESGEYLLGFLQSQEIRGIPMLGFVRTAIGMIGEHVSLIEDPQIDEGFGVIPGCARSHVRRPSNFAIRHPALALRHTLIDMELMPANLIALHHPPSYHALKVMFPGCVVH
jgi:hypothetical protein